MSFQLKHDSPQNKHFFLFYRNQVHHFTNSPSFLITENCAPYQNTSIIYTPDLVAVVGYRVLRLVITSPLFFCPQGWKENVKSTNSTLQQNSYYILLRFVEFPSTVCKQSSFPHNLFHPFFPYTESRVCSFRSYWQDIQNTFHPHNKYLSKSSQLCSTKS